MDADGLADDDWPWSLSVVDPSLSAVVCRQSQAMACPAPGRLLIMLRPLFMPPQRSPFSSISQSLRPLACFLQSSQISRPQSRCAITLATMRQAAELVGQRGSRPITEPLGHAIAQNDGERTHSRGFLKTSISGVTYTYGVDYE